jgi:uncharacterized iron-regulated protein
MILFAVMAGALAAYPLWHLFGASAPSEALLRLSSRTIGSVEEVAAELQEVSFVFLGERHDRASHHEAQLTMIRALHESGRPFAIGLEMIQAAHQQVLDAWVAGDLGEEELRRVYAADWSFPWAYYGKIFRYAREQRIPLLGLNVGREIPRQVARLGFQSLDPSQRRELPPVSCDVDSTYEEFIRRALGDHGLQPEAFARFCEAQRLWDVVMAWNLVQFLQKHPHHQVAVLAGSAHSWKRGIPDQVRRLSSASTAVILPEPSQDFEHGPFDVEDADYLWLGLD